MTQISREVEGQVSIPYKTSRIVPDGNTKQIIANKETQKGQAVEDNVKTIQQVQLLKGRNVDVIA